MFHQKLIADIVEVAKDILCHKHKQLNGRKPAINLYIVPTGNGQLQLAAGYTTDEITSKEFQAISGEFLDRITPMVAQAFERNREAIERIVREYYPTRERLSTKILAWEYTKLVINMAGLKLCNHKYDVKQDYLGRISISPPDHQPG